MIANAKSEVSTGMMVLLSGIKVFWLIFWLGFATLILAPLVIVAAFLESEGNVSFAITKIWAWVVLQAVGCRTTVRGKEKIIKGQSYIIISNHQSHFDALALVTTLGIQIRWVGKKELLKIPLFGWALRQAGTIFVDRSSTEKAIRSIEEGIGRLHPGVSILFFAEGSRSTDGELQAFKKGGFVSAINTGLPILPVTVNGSRKILPKGSFVFHSGPIEVVVGQPIDTLGFYQKGLEALMQETRMLMASNLRSGYSGES
jgi:1-acyl-sn-glycerol-3-phosphate acyltransferase